MKQDPSRGGGSTLSPAYSAALEALAKKRKENNEDKPWYEDVAGAIGGALKYVYDNAPSSNPVSTPVNMGGGTVSMGGQGTGKSLVTEPARLAVRRAVGDVTAIPGVGEPSSSYTADQVRQQGVVRGVVGATLDYSQFLPVVAKGTRVAGDVVNASKLAAMERRANPFPALRGEMGNVIDVVEGSRLPATVVETPSNPYRTTRNALAEDMAQAQVPRPTVTPATISPRLEVPTMAPTVPDMPPGFPLPEVPSNMTLQDFQRMPEYQAYIEAGQSIDPRAMAGFAFDPETAYLVHSGRGQLIGGKLDPYRTLSGLNDSHTRAVLAGRDRAIASADVLQDQLDTFVRTGIWNGDELAQRMPPGYSSEGGRVPLKGVVKALDMSERQLQEFVDRIQTRINDHTNFYSSVEPFAALARREPFLSYYPAPVGGKSGYMGWHSGPEGGGMYLAAVPADRATTLFGPGIYEKQLGVPEWQAFGEQTPIASIGQFPKDWSGYSQLESATRAFAVQKTIEDRMRRGFYGDVTPRPLPVRSFSGDFVPVGNAARRPDGSPIRLSTPDESAMFVSFGYSLREVPTEHLFDAVTKNLGFRFDPISTEGIAQGVVRFRDKVTGEVIDFRNGMPVTSEVTTPQAGRTMNPVEELAAAQAQQNVVPLFPEQPPSPSRLRVTNAKLGQSDVADLASYREARNPRLRRFNPNAGDDLYPQGTTFVGKPGAPGRNEAMRKLPSFSTVYEFKFDPEDGLTEDDFFKEGIGVEDYDLFQGLLTTAEDYKLPQAEQFKVALTNFAQRMGADAIVVNDELILVPRGKLFKDYFAEDEFGLSAIDITPTNRRTMNTD